MPHNHLATKGWRVPSTIVHDVDCDMWDKIIKDRMDKSIDWTNIVLWVLGAFTALGAMVFNSKLGTKTTHEDVRRIVADVLNEYHTRVTISNEQTQNRRHEENQAWLKRIEQKLDRAV